MHKLVALFLLLSTSAFAQAVPRNVTVNCFFDGGPSTKLNPFPIDCHAVANFHFEIDRDAEDHLLVNCPGLGEDTIVYNDEAEYHVNTGTVIEPAGDLSLPSVLLPAGAFNCRQNPTSFDATLTLPGQAPYLGQVSQGSCMVVTAGCAVD